MSLCQTNKQGFTLLLINISCFPAISSSTDGDDNDKTSTCSCPSAIYFSLESHLHYRSMLQMSLRSIQFSALLFLLVSAVSLPHRSSGDGSIEKEKTLAMIKPDGLFGSYTNAIKEIILDSGFSICKEMTIHLDEDTVKSFYAVHSSKSFFPSLVNYMTSGPVLIMVLEKVNAVADWRAMIGPTDARKAKVTHPNSIRAMCGLDSQTNCVHGSDSSESAAREISFFFKEASSAVSKHDEL
ncbi:probable nucleoside diphosphate kinase 5 isoform X2 [Camellia sinensis]|uniref:probable nucleoside diphosphate kinase 5 isoform X2 n=2 Tax=Camellia sinensis TaxID=4442 RepID=UPI001035B6B6|nr:probable nucleoside diphosphate kinase 5 isoform X2 [Camellia sinensis]